MLNRNFESIKNAFLDKKIPFQNNFIDYLTTKYFSIESDVFAYENIQNSDINVKFNSEINEKALEETFLIFIDSEYSNEKLLEKIQNIDALKYSENKNSWNKFLKLPAINPDYSISNFSISGGSGFSLHEMQNAVKASNKKFVYITILNKNSIDSIKKLISAIQFSNVNSLSEISKNKNLQYFPMLINGETKVFHYSSILQKKLEEEIKLADYCCTGNFALTSEYFLSIENPTVKKIRYHSNKMILDCVYSDIIETISNFTFIETK